MTETVEVQQLPTLKKTIVTDAFEGQPEMLGVTITFARAFAEQAAGHLGLNVAESLKAQVYSLFAPEVVRALTAGEAVEFDSGPSMRVVEDQKLAGFVGLVLFVGTDEARCALLKGERGATVIAVPRCNAERAGALNAFPDAGILEFKPEPNLPPLSESQASRARWFDERYDCLSIGLLSPRGERVVLGDGEPQVCRYCGNSKLDVSFSNISHAFPEQIGNKRLIDSRECDKCNSHFASAIETPFGNWSLLARSTGRIRGKRGAPTFETPDKDLRIDVKNGNLKVTVRNGDPRFLFDDDAKQITMSPERPPYIPMGVFKSFVKMALAVMPESEGSYCQHLKTWILQKTHTYESFPYAPLMLYSQFILGPVPSDEITYFLLRRKDAATNCPYLIFVIQYGNHVHQICLPMPEQDNPGSGEVQLELMYFPHRWDTTEHVAKYGPSRLISEDLSSPEIKRGDPYPMRFSFESAQETTPPNSD